MILQPSPVLVLTIVALIVLAWSDLRLALWVLAVLLAPAVVFSVATSRRDRKRPFPVDALLYAIKWWYVYALHGGPKGMARHAIRAILRGSGLTRHQYARKVFGYDDAGAEHRQVFLAMGKDAAPGRLDYDEENERLRADLDLYHLIPGYTKEEGLMGDIAQELGGELRTSPAWAFVGKPFATHNQGGCAMAESAKHGVVDADGRVWGCQGLYVLDGSVFPKSVGVNPSATIAAVAERCISVFIATHAPWDRNSPGYREYRAQRDRARRWKEASKSWAVEPKHIEDVPIRTPPLALEFDERMQGFYQPGEHDLSRDPLVRDAQHRLLETQGRPAFSLGVKLTARVANLPSFFEDLNHELEIQGTLRGRLPHESVEGDYHVSGTLRLMVQRYKPYGLSETDYDRRRAQRRLSDAHRYRTRTGKPDPTRFLHYRLEVEGQGITIDGIKRIRDDPGIDAWRDTASLFVTLYDAAGTVLGAGTIHVDVPGFLYGQLPSLRAGYVRDGKFVHTTDATQAAWAIAKFGGFFFGSLQRIYAAGTAQALMAGFQPFSNNVVR
jgi:hypothetical protein